MTNPHELKVLQSRLKEAQAEADSYIERARVANDAASEALKRRDRIQAQIREIEEAAKEPIVTEHALLRYIERFMNVDLEQVRKAILTEQAVKLIKFTRTGKVTTDGRRLVIKNGTVVTVEPTQREAA
ncbi:MAG: hypothetical protein CPSOU_1818 [uncultured Paraburkholderia sp.]|nr:MAG: hypothetical protein CPSOU_1818 [uncultured Paraburkholderia sp.]